MFDMYIVHMLNVCVSYAVYIFVIILGEFGVISDTESSASAANTLGSVVREWCSVPMDDFLSINLLWGDVADNSSKNQAASVRLFNLSRLDYGAKDA